MNDERYLRRPQVEAMTGLSRSSIYRLMSEGLFVRPYRIGKTAVRWRCSEVERWLAERPLTAKDRLSRWVSDLIGGSFKEIDNGRLAFGYRQCV